VVVGEYKGPRTDLDLKQNGIGYQNRTPVEQARNYASLVSTCRFYLVIIMTEWRLYARNGNPDRYERWFLSDLCSPAQYWRFTSLLSEHAILNGNTLRWLQESEQQDKEITRALYSEYQTMRWDSIISLAEANPGLTALAIIDPAQTLLDRILFIAFAEDNGLLPAHTFTTYALDNATHSAWDNLKALFHAIDQGSRDRPLPQKSTGLERGFIRFKGDSSFRYGCRSRRPRSESSHRDVKLCLVPRLNNASVVSLRYHPWHRHAGIHAVMTVLAEVPC
jgi:hypothetical protein